MSTFQIQDTLNYIGKLTPFRLWNASKVFSSYFLSKFTKNNHHKGLPISISIEPTTSCNLRCPQCPSGLRSFTRPTGMLSKDLNKKIINELSKTLTYITYYFQGEPYLNRDFTDMVSYAKDHNIYTSTSTNGHYLSEANCKATIESGLDRLIISMDGITQETYKEYRVGGDLQKVFDGTKRLSQMKKEMNSKTPYIIWQFIVFKHNEDQIPRLKELAKELGVNKLALKTAQVYDFEGGHELIPDNDKYSRYAKDGESLKIKNKLLNHCWRMWQSCVITWDGKIAPCCFDKDASYQLGDLNKNTFNSIWKNADYQSFRSLVLKSRKNIDICKNCSEGTQIWN